MEIHLARDGRKFGPYSEEEVRTKLHAGELQAGDLAWYEGAPDWMPVSALPMLHVQGSASAGGLPPPLVPRLPTLQNAPTSGLAIASLVCGIASWTVLPLIPALPAVICGHMALGQIRRSAGALGGRGLALAGLIIGYVTMALVVVGIVALIVFGFAVAPVIKESMVNPQIHSDSSSAGHAAPDAEEEAVVLPPPDQPEPTTPKID